MELPIKILSVDDEETLETLLNQYFRRQIRKGEYELYFVHNGEEALALLKEQPDIEIVLSDINMPVMDGLTFLGKLMEMKHPSRKCIMVTAYDDIANIREAMNKDAFDFITKPIDLNDLSITIEKTIKQIDFIHQSQQEHTQLQLLNEDLKVASNIQQSILPKADPPFPEHAGKLDIAAFMEAAKNIGGDFYDYLRLDESTIGFAIADVCGKGIPAALFMAVSRTLMHYVVKKISQPSQCVYYSNNVLSDNSLDSMFVTVFCGSYNVDTGLVTYCNAGHNPPFLVKSTGEISELPSAYDVAPGVAENMEYHDFTVQLEKGDTLFMFTDGVTEASDGHRHQFGKEGLKATLEEVAMRDCKEMIEYVREDISAFVGDAEQSDDITMLALKRI